MTQLGGDFVFGPGALHAGYLFSTWDSCAYQGQYVLSLRGCSTQRIVSILATMDQYPLMPLYLDIEVSELIQHLGITARPCSPSQTLTALTVSERSRRNCAELLPDELVIVPSQLEDLRSIPSP